LRVSCNVSCTFYVKMTDENFPGSFIITHNNAINFLQHTEVNAFTFRSIYLRHLFRGDRGESSAPFILSLFQN
jgi:hypothetical protein